MGVVWLCSDAQSLSYSRSSSSSSASSPTADRTPHHKTTENDVDREKGRSYRRTVFYQENWRVHRSITRYFRHMDGAPRAAVAQSGRTAVLRSSC